MLIFLIGCQSNLLSFFAPQANVASVKLIRFWLERQKNLWPTKIRRYEGAFMLNERNNYWTVIESEKKNVLTFAVFYLFCSIVCDFAYRGFPPRS